MLISQFSKAAGLSQDTIRFYIRRGLLTPQLSGKGGRNPYQSFTEADVITARFIRFSQSMGMSLAEISAINQERLVGISRERSIEIMTGQLAQLEAKIAEFTVMAEYLTAKIAWQRAGNPGPAPQLRPRLPNNHAAPLAPTPASR
jgi:MerR family copper efflux transcriptional regulator